MELELKTLQAVHEEHDAWLALVKASEGAVITREDWETPIGTLGSPGLALISAIRAWGDRLVALRLAERGGGL
ncbi:MAG: hypothetical protein ACREH7_03930 [Candidatus Rokuibacteriota bacterium]